LFFCYLGITFCFKFWKKEKSFREKRAQKSERNRGKRREKKSFNFFLIFCYGGRLYSLLCFNFSVKDTITRGLCFLKDFSSGGGTKNDFFLEGSCFQMLFKVFFISVLWVDLISLFLFSFWVLCSIIIL